MKRAPIVSGPLAAPAAHRATDVAATADAKMRVKGFVRMCLSSTKQSRAGSPSDTQTTPMRHDWPKLRQALAAAPVQGNASREGRGFASHGTFHKAAP